MSYAVSLLSRYILLVSMNCSFMFVPPYYFLTRLRKELMKVMPLRSFIRANSRPYSLAKSILAILSFLIAYYSC